MASAASIMGASADAPPPFPSVASKQDIVYHFENIIAEFSNLGAVIDAASDEAGPGLKVSYRGIQLLSAAQFMFRTLEADFNKAVNDSMAAARV